ncbi:hypothetical protein [Nonomuraea fuscirosea]|uniref:hypothetical protein n=1 Tax=Nonomuraea fuscirosea TaxID=1291556 RepID=UPI00342DC146
MVDPGGHVDHLAGVVQGRAERCALMRAIMVEMALVLGQDLAQVALAMDEQVVEPLAA